MPGKSSEAARDALAATKNYAAVTGSITFDAQRNPTKSAVVLKELVEKGTEGRVQVTIFPDGQLGSNGPMTNSVKAGTSTRE